MANQVDFGAGASGAPPPDLSTLFGVPTGTFNQPIETNPGKPFGTGFGGLLPTAPSYSTVGDALESFYGLSPDQVSGLQQQLYGTPFWTSSKAPVLGNANDPNTFDAYKNAVIAAARSGKTLNEVLGAGATGETGLGAPSAPSGGGIRVYPGGKVAVSQTDPETIRLGANAAYQKLMGRDMNDQEAQAVINTVRSDEAKKGAQQASLDQSQRETQIQTNEALYGPTGAAAGTPGSAPQGKLSPEDRAKVAYAAGFRGQALVDAVAVSMAEGDVGEINNNPKTGDYSVGPWQINYYGDLRGPRTAKYGDPQALANDPQANAAAAFDLSGGGKDFAPWSTYKSGAYKQYLSAATAAAAPYLQGNLASAGVPVQGVTAGGSQGTTTDIFLQPTIADISTPITPEGAATQQIQTQNTSEMQEYGAQRQIQNFTTALHSVPGDTGATNPAAVKP